MKPKELGTIMGIWAHPDDESFCCAGLMSEASKNGQKVICITATRGEVGIQDVKKWPAEKLGEIRSAEMAAACKVLGIKCHHWLGYKDGCCDEINDSEAVKKLVVYIDKYKPDAILTFGPEGFTGHPDHQAASRWATSAAKKSVCRPKVYYAVQLRKVYEDYLEELDKKFNIFFKIDKPPLYDEKDCAIFYKVKGEVADKKYEAFKVMPSQTARMLKELDKDAFCAVFGTECFVAAPSTA